MYAIILQREKIYQISCSKENKKIKNKKNTE